MTTSLAQESYSITLNDDQLAAITSFTASSTINLSNTSSSTICYTGASSAPYTYTTSTTMGTGPQCIPSISITNIAGLWGGAEWVDGFPAWARVESMCKEYPGLKIAFENFKTVYNLVKDDYDTPDDKKIRP